MTFKIKLLLIAVLAAFPMLTPSAAEAGPKCKTYTKAMYINGYRETGHAKACRHRGEWEITKLNGHRAVRAALARKINHDLYGGHARIIVLDRDGYNKNNRHYNKKGHRYHHKQKHRQKQSRGYGNRHGYDYGYDRVRYDQSRQYNNIYGAFRILGQKAGGGHNSKHAHDGYRKRH